MGKLRLSAVARLVCVPDVGNNHAAVYVSYRNVCTGETMTPGVVIARTTSSDNIGVRHDCGGHKG